jgi:hypothetical protein
MLDRVDADWGWLGLELLPLSLSVGCLIGTERLGDGFSGVIPLGQREQTLLREGISEVRDAPHPRACCL